MFFRARVENVEFCGGIVMHSSSNIKTFKYLKWTKYAALLYFFFCLISGTLMYFDVIHRSETAFNLIAPSILLWVANPMVLIVSSIGFVTYLKERKDAVKKEQIGKRRIAFLGWNVFAMLLWIVTIVCFVLVTGGV